jgi:hypothetical protein
LGTPDVPLDCRKALHHYAILVNLKLNGGSN